MTVSGPEERLGTISRRPVGRFTLFTVQGKNTTEFLKLLADTILGGSGPAALELDEIDLINSAIVGFLMMLKRQLGAADREFCLVAPSPKLTDVLHVTHTIHEMTVVDGADDLESV